MDTKQVRRFRPWFWLKIAPGWRIGVRPDEGFKLFSERYGLTRVWRIFGYAISFKRSPCAPLFIGGWWIDGKREGQ